MGACFSADDQSPDNFTVKDGHHGRSNAKASSSNGGGGAGGGSGSGGGINGSRADREPVTRYFMVGMGSAGKSTVVRQLNRLVRVKPADYAVYDDQWNELRQQTVERNAAGQARRWRMVIRRNVFDALVALVKKAREWNLDVASESADRLMQLHDSAASVPGRAPVDFEADPLLPELVVSVFLIPSIQEVLSRRTQIRSPLIADGTYRFLTNDKIRDVFSAGYEPREDDIVHARDPTTGMTDYRFRVKGQLVSLRDIGGQKVERAKTLTYLNQWMADDRNSYRNMILYVVSMAEYDVPHPEHEGATLLEESLQMLKIVLELNALRDCGFLVLLNKEDIFRAKMDALKTDAAARREAVRRLGPWLSKTDKERLERGADLPYDTLRKTVAAMTADKLSESALAGKKDVYMRFTCAVDTKLMDALWATVKVEIMSGHIDRADYLFP